MPHSSEPLSFAALRNQLVVSGELLAETALRIGAGRAGDATGADLPVLRDALGRPFIPGASLKGALRARLEGLIRAVAPGQALDLEQIERRTCEQVRPLRERARDDAELSRAIWQMSTMIDLTFGSPELAGRLFVKDAQLAGERWAGRHEVRNGVAINRDTETAEEGLLYSYEVAPAGTRFEFELALENADPWQLGMLLLALKPWERGEVAIGGFRSRGLGRVRLLTRARRYCEIDSVDAIVDLLAGGIARAGRDVSEQQEREWIGAFRDRLAGLAPAAEVSDA